MAPSASWIRQEVDFNHSTAFVHRYCNDPPPNFTKSYNPRLIQQYMYFRLVFGGGGFVAGCSRFCMVVEQPKSNQGRARPIVYTPKILFRFQIRCFLSKSENRKCDLGQKPRPNCALIDPTVKLEKG